MAEELLSDEQQAEALRRWWSENWRWVIAGIALGLVGLVGWQQWQQHKIGRAETAAYLYRDFAAAINASDRSKAEALLKELEQKYGGSPYTDQGHLALATANVSEGKFEQAASELKIVAESTADKALKPIAQLRLARVQLQLGHQDEALAALNIDQAGAYLAQYQEVRGDALLAKGDASGAKQAYQLALNATQDQANSATASNGDTAMLQLKLQDLQLPASSPAVANPAAVNK
jgi:predicted negative regulator of RcsB-dependent stress response